MPKIEENGFVVRIYGPNDEAVSQWKGALFVTQRADRKRYSQKQIPVENWRDAILDESNQSSIASKGTGTSSAQYSGEHGPAHAHITWVGNDGIPRETRFLLLVTTPNASGTYYSCVHFPNKAEQDAPLPEDEIKAAGDFVKRKINDVIHLWQEAHRGNPLENEFLTPSKATEYLKNSSGRNGTSRSF